MKMGLGALALLPLSIAPAIGCQHTGLPRSHHHSLFPFVITSTSDPSSAKPVHARYPRGFTASSSSINGGKPDESAFSDDDRAVGGMDAYLNQLSLEYDSVWDTKPSWCQPWTIVLSGVTAITLSWLLLQSAIISCGVSCLIFAWWYIFLYAYPKAYTKMIAERRKNVNTGVEDTFGFRNIQ